MFTCSVPSISVSISRCASTVPSTSQVALLCDSRLHSALDTALIRSAFGRGAPHVIGSGGGGIDLNVVERSALLRRERGLDVARRAVADADEIAAGRLRPLEFGDGSMRRKTVALRAPYAASAATLSVDGMEAEQLREARWRGEMSAAAASMRALPNTRSASGFSTAAAAVSYVAPHRVSSSRHVGTPWGVKNGRTARGAAPPPNHTDTMTPHEPLERLVGTRPFWSYLEYISQSHAPISSAAGVGVRGV